jgi:secretion/DNA translocation related TadE-like protein
MPAIGTPRERRVDSGSATVVVLAGTGIAVMLLVAGLALASAVGATHRARAAADLGALAAAQAIQRGVAPVAACALASSVMARNGARPQGCDVAGDGSVTSSATATAAFTLPGTTLGTTTATARAGPSRRGPLSRGHPGRGQPSRGQPGRGQPGRAP